jgi:hypothetical protein
MSLYRRFKDRFGTAGVVLGVIAIVLALGGSALAASGLNGKQKKEVKAIAKSFQGSGPAGANGSNGANGAPGANGKDGSNGATGLSGANGLSVTSQPEPPGVNCTTGGVEFTSASPEPDYACNGAAGPQGSPWTAGGTLPVGKTETGTWAFGENSDSSIGIFVPISFNIPLASPLDGGHTVYVPPAPEPNPDPTHCAGSAVNPTAASGYLCAYAGFVLQANFNGIADPTGAPGAGVSGAALVFGISPDPGPPATTKAGVGIGSWAVTG